MDLKRRGLLDDTLVIWGGEFGRTPMVETNAALGRSQGRDASKIETWDALTAVLAMASFSGLALVMAGSLRPEATLAVANLLYLVGMPLGILIPVAAYPAWAQPVLSALPTAALGESMRAAAESTTLWWPLGVAAAWALLLWFVTRKVFSWTS